MSQAETVSVHVPLTLRKFGGRKVVITPEGNTALVRPRAHIDSTLVKALARAFRWRRQLETGVHDCVRDIAKAEKINESYVSRVLRLSLLAPDIVEAIVAGRAPGGLALPRLMQPFSTCWALQRFEILNQGL